jgi:hypothetical protein
LRIDEEVKQRMRALRTSTSWHRATQSDVMRAIMFAGLPIVEAQYQPTADQARPRSKPRPSK